MTELPGYDAWLSRGYDQDSAPCTCGHEAGDHDVDDTCTQCDCEDYVEYTRGEYLEDMRERRAEYRGGL